MMDLTTLGIFHMSAAALSLVFGAGQFLRTKRDAVHRRLGYTYVFTMAVNCGTALAIYRFNGRFNAFHALALYGLFNVAMALRPMLKNPRPFQWRRQHYMWVGWSYAGLCAAATTEFLLRVVRIDALIATGIGTTIPIIIGSILIPKFAPPLRKAAGANEGQPA